MTLALDGDGRPHVVTTGRTADLMPLLIYAHTSPAGWVSETIELEEKADFYVSLAFDSGNRPVIHYQSYGAEYQGRIIWLTRREASGWTHQSLVQGTYIGGSSLALDAADRVNVVFNDSDRLVYLHQTANGWQTLAESGTGYSPSLALDDADRPHVAYADTNGDYVADPLPMVAFAGCGLQPARSPCRWRKNGAIMGPGHALPVRQ